MENDNKKPETRKLVLAAGLMNRLTLLLQSHFIKEIRDIYTFSSFFFEALPVFSTI